MVNNRGRETTRHPIKKILNKTKFVLTKKRNLLVLCILVSITFCYFTLFHINQNESSIPETHTFHFDYVTSIDNTKKGDITPITRKDDISCHYATEEDGLPSAEDASFSPPDGSIFFHETSCHGRINSRQACAIESAAKAHQGKTIYVLFSGPITENLLYFTRSNLSELKRYPNIKFARVHIDEYAKGTALQEMLSKRKHKESLWKVVHTSDLLRFITLFKYGGLYMDTDVIVVKPFDSLGRNWLAKESGSYGNNAVVNVAKDELGRDFIRKVLEELSETYKPKEWGYNGPGVVTRVLNKLCNTTVDQFSKERCGGFNVYNPEVIYPVSYNDFKKFFEPGDLQNVDKAYSFHLWNQLSHNVKVQRDSPFDKLAKLHCPIIRELYGDAFGI